MKKKEIKLIIFLSTLLLAFTIFLFLTFKDYNYEKEYVIDHFKIIEEYNKEDNVYTFLLEDEDSIYPFVLKNKYLRKRELIKDIKVYKNEAEICILPISDKLKFYPLCNNNDEIFTYNLTTLKDVDYNYDKIDILDKEYQKIKINYLNNNSFLLYNYKGFYFLNESKNEEIKLFNKDVYSIDLTYQKDEYLIIPNYNQDYYFNKFYILNIKNGKVKEMDFEYDISFESIFLGDYKNNIYLLDKKEEKEYRINIKKEKVEEIDFQVLKDGKMVKTTYKEIVNKNLNFFDKKIYNYDIINNNLYLIVANNKIKLSNNKVNKIVKNDGDTVYYLSDEKLYMYNNTYGEVLLLSSFEWNFNNTNMIYLYK